MPSRDTLLSKLRRHAGRSAVFGTLLSIAFSAAAEEVDFATAENGPAPAAFDTRMRTGGGRPGRWEVVSDNTAKGSKALAQLEADPTDYDGLVLPGGVANPDFLRTDEGAVGFVRAFFEQGKPVGVICHGPWTLVEAGVVKGRKITSWPSLRTDIENAGGKWVDEQVVVDAGLVSSRKPDDLPAFCAKIIEELGEGVQEEAEQSATASA